MSDTTKRYQKDLTSTERAIKYSKEFPWQSSEGPNRETPKTNKQKNPHCFTEAGPK